MLKDCLEIFRKEIDSKGDSIVLNEYVLPDGTYIIVENKEDTFKIKEVINIKFDKKTREVDRSSIYNDKLCFYHYNSYYLASNKAIRDKNIFSNNYLTFFIKKQSIYSGKITNDTIDIYHTILKNPYFKYTKTIDKKVYEKVEKALGEVDADKVEKINSWIKENIYDLAEKYKGKDQLNIFFEAGDDEYIREGERYYIPNIYNSRDYMTKVKDEFYGVHNNNVNMNTKKPFLKNNTRNEIIPYLIDNKEVVLQKKFFDYLTNQANLGRGNIYLNDEGIISTKNNEVLDKGFSGIYLRLKKGKEVEIQSYDIITNYKPNFIDTFYYSNILGDKEEKLKENIKIKNKEEREEKEFYGEINDRKRMQEVIDNVVFSKYLKSNYFTEPQKISVKESALKRNLLIAREPIFNWLYKGYKNGIEEILIKVSSNLIKRSIDKGYIKKAKEQFNLRWSFEEYFKGGTSMADVVYKIHSSLREKINSKDIEVITSDDEFYFAIGQLVNYLLSLSRSKNKPQSLLNPFINSKNNEVIIEKLRKLYFKYNYSINQRSKRFNNLYGMVLSYSPSKEVNQDMILAGYLKNSLIYEKDNKEER